MTSGCSPRAAGSAPSTGSRATTTSSRCCSACVRNAAISSCARDTGCASTCRSAGTGTPTRCAGCRRTRASRATSPATPSAASSDVTVQTVRCECARLGCSFQTDARPKLARPDVGTASGASVIWTRAEGCRVWDGNGREFLDLTGGFGVAALGHGNAKIREAVASAPVVHALGDLAEAEATQRLRGALPWPAKLGVTGEDAIEIALRTALLAT